MTLPFTPRPSQSEILSYRRGHLGIAAVPGAGKTQILSKLAADIIMRGQLGEGQEVLIVTLVNSAVDNFEGRIKRFFTNPVQALYKYRVRTLHGLAHDIVREKPARVGFTPTRSTSSSPPSASTAPSTNATRSSLRTIRSISRCPACQFCSRI